VCVLSTLIALVRAPLWRSDSTTLRALRWDCFSLLISSNYDTPSAEKGHYQELALSTALLPLPWLATRSSFSPPCLLVFQVDAGAPPTSVMGFGAGEPVTCVRDSVFFLPALLIRTEEGMTPRVKAKVLALRPGGLRFSTLLVGPW
jgi:hypothetical protein